MSQENVQIVRRAFESFNRRDLAGALAVFEPEAEWVPYLAALEEEIYRGRGDIDRMWREVLRDVPDFHIEFVQVVADSPDVVVFEVEFRGTGKASGVDIRTSVYQAASFRDGKVTQESRDSAPPPRPSKVLGWGSSATRRHSGGL